ncbi:ensconsin-like isoform X2 [Phymastichus coffea]|uniref:ensconsin-like isoform X2 n=1 Tax=Phymastichus coffea TaxID=108790 RepID=UPI00273B4F57|nr:ensconsin-like isoform X2 [Phymastichus coffea]
MFSELCRETLRKAAVCRGRSAAPAREAGARRRPARPTSLGARRAGSGLESRDGRRAPYAADCALCCCEAACEARSCRGARPRRPRSASPELLPPRVRRLHRCRARSSSSSSGPSDDESSASSDEAGATADESQRPSSAHNRQSLTKEETMHWFARIGSDEDAILASDLRQRNSHDFDADSLDGDHPYEYQGREPTAALGVGPGVERSNSAKELDRARLVRERQQEERQRKLKELRQQALAAQRFREQREEERRKRIEELRLRDNDRRSQVEERKRLIWEAERDRREAILRRNQEREARIEAKRKNERSQIVFAFGSSTPRMLEPADTGGFWGTRRATSTSNVINQHPAPLTRRSSERELDGSKKRAASAGGADRKPGEEGAEAAAGVSTRFANRRRTDLVPTLPGRSSSLAASSSKAFARSPGRTYSMSRLDRLAQPRRRAGPPAGLAQASMSRSMSQLARPAPAPGLGRPDNSRSMGALPGPTRAERLRRKAREHANPGLRSGEVTPNSPSRPHSSMSQQSASSSVASSTVNLRPRTGTPRRPRPASIAGTGVTTSQHNEAAKQQKDAKPPLPKAHAGGTGGTGGAGTPRKPAPPAAKPERRSAPAPPRSAKASPRATPRPSPLQSPGAEPPGPPDEGPAPEEPPRPEEDLGDEQQADMTASMIQKIRITTEEEAKAALAERRRLAREQAEREAELEKQRREQEATLEAERLRAEEEAQRRLEEETIRLAEEARLAEEQRLRQAIEEAERRQEEERKRREDELRQKLEKEEAERSVSQRLEMVERQKKKEEEERNARRKRVEAIMSRTRAKNQPNAQKGDGTDGDKSKEDSPSEESKSAPGDDKSAQSLMTSSLLSEATLQLIRSEQCAHEASGEGDVVRNGTSHPSNGVGEPAGKHQQQQQQQQQQQPSSSPQPQPPQPPQPSLVDNEELNGHRNNGSSHGNGIGIDTQSIALDNATVKQNNVTNNLLDLSEFDLLSNSNSSPILMSNNNEDNVNSNLNPTAIPFTPNFVMPAATNANPFQDPFVSNKQQDNQVQDLLS